LDAATIIQELYISKKRKKKQENKENLRQPPNTYLQMANLWNRIHPILPTYLGENNQHNLSTRTL